MEIKESHPREGPGGGLRCRRLRRGGGGRDVRNSPGGVPGTRPARRHGLDGPDGGAPREPRALWAEARSVVVLGTSYAPADDPLASLARRDRATVSVYARGRDYHDVLKKRLKGLGRWMAEAYACQVKVFVDTAPVMEKPLAARAGIGWQGKHTNLVSRHFAPGSSWARCSPPSTSPPTPRPPISAGPATAVATPARRMRLPNPTASIPGAASRT